MHNNNDQHEAKAAEDARRAAESKAAEDARRAAEAKAAEDARRAAEAKAAEDARRAAEAKAHENARRAAEAGLAAWPILAVAVAFTFLLLIAGVAAENWLTPRRNSPEQSDRAGAT